MSTDEAMTQDLVMTLENGKEGFEKAAKKLAETNEPQLAETFSGYARDRARMSAELVGLAGTYGDQIRETSTTAGAVHRGWMAVKDALSGHDAKGVLDAAVQGEEHAVSEFEKALREDLSPGMRDVVSRQLAEVARVRDHVRRLQQAH